jgi:hypothetical protein
VDTAKNCMNEHDRAVLLWIGPNKRSVTKVDRSLECNERWMVTNEWKRQLEL